MQHCNAKQWTKNVTFPSLFLKLKALLRYNPGNELPTIQINFNTHCLKTLPVCKHCSKLSKTPSSSSSITYYYTTFEWHNNIFTSFSNIINARSCLFWLRHFVHFFSFSQFLCTAKQINARAIL